MHRSYTTSHNGRREELLIDHVQIDHDMSIQHGTQLSDPK